MDSRYLSVLLKLHPHDALGGRSRQHIRAGRRVTTRPSFNDFLFPSLRRDRVKTRRNEAEVVGTTQREILRWLIAIGGIELLFDSVYGRVELVTWWTGGSQGKMLLKAEMIPARRPTLLRERHNAAV